MDIEIHNISPVPTRFGDIVGFVSEKTFVLLVPTTYPTTDEDTPSEARKLPRPASEGEILKATPCLVSNNQRISLVTGEAATLHDINGKWHFLPAAEYGNVTKMRGLEAGTFFTITTL